MDNINIYNELKEINQSIVELRTTVQNLSQTLSDVKSKLDNVIPRVQTLEDSKKDMAEFEEARDKRQNRVITYVFLLFTVINVIIQVAFKIF
jgi:t-SNARE complex subunit (syntaxin)